MPLRYVLDEHLRGPLWVALQQHNTGGAYPVDVVRMGDPPDLPCGTKDPALLLWAEREGRLVVTAAKRTMPVHLAAHLRAGHHSPGVCLLPAGHSFADIAFRLALAAHASDPAEWRDQWKFLP
jgi:hypothetical protein